MKFSDVLSAADVTLKTDNEHLLLLNMKIEY